MSGRVRVLFTQVHLRDLCHFGYQGSKAHFLVLFLLQDVLSKRALVLGALIPQF